jgi:hypothetical protein
VFNDAPAATIEACGEVDPKTTVKNMFKMDKHGADAPRNTYLNNSHFMTSQIHAHALTKKSAECVKKTNLHTVAGATDFLGEDVDQDVLQVSAKREGKIWYSQQYKDPEHRNVLNVTTNRGAQDNIDIELSEKLRCCQHNLRVTNITEYSNALNRGRVFTNPKFSSC